MSFHRRIRTVYGKELIDILRDHRTLIAMIVVPIVLYPLLLLGSIQAVSYQREKFAEEEIVIGTASEAQAEALGRLIRADAAALREAAELMSAEAEDAEASRPLEKYRLVALGSTDDIEAHIGNHTIHVGVTMDHSPLIDAIDVTNEVRFYVDHENARGYSAYRRLVAVFERTAEQTRTQRIIDADLPPEFVSPFQIETVNLAAPQSILGQVLPLILVLMTITGAIYPAIDLTAGERERGTLESLMVCPIPVLDVIVGKFLVVTTVAIMGAALNLASVSATVYFGGFNQVIATQGGGVPVGSMLFILLSLVPFAVLMSAIMIAVCSYARTFKEAQNYVTPVILAVLIPGGIAALPTTRLDGVMLVMPVGNMVLLAREFLLGAVVPFSHLLTVLLSTTLYAAAAVAVAANIFGQESVVFADAGSIKTRLNRRLIRPSSRPTVAMSLLTVAVLFPVWFFVQSAIQSGADSDVRGVLIQSGWLMPAMFVLLPLGLVVYWKIDIRGAFALRAPRARYLLAGALIGLSAWVPAHELNVLQYRVLGAPQAVFESAGQMGDALRSMPVATVFLLIAVVPALCEEFLFRGFLLSGVSGGSRKWRAILVSGLVFGVFHFFLFKFPVTFALGVVLAYLCWQARSIWPTVLAHGLHNAVAVSSVVHPQWRTWMGIAEPSPTATGAEQEAEALGTHLPPLVVVVGVTVLIAALFLVSHRGTTAPAGAPSAAPS